MQKTCALKNKHARFTQTQDIAILVLLSIPLIGLLVLSFIPGANKKAIKQCSFSFLSLSFVFSLLLWVGFDQSTPKFQYLVNFLWLPLSNINFVLGVDGISLPFLILTTFIFPLAILSSWSSVQLNFKFYARSFFIMEFILIMVFSCLDLIFFYTFFEALLIPMFFVIILFGSRERRVRAAYLFFLYTLLGSLFMLVGVGYAYALAGGTSYELLHGFNFSYSDQKWIWLAFFASFATKVPMLPLHIWLPEAHVEAPTAGSVLLAGILLKLGSYGFLRFSLGLLPQACSFFTPVMFCLGVFGIIFASLTAIRQTDMKRLIAYTSVAHMNLVIISIFTGSAIGIQGSLLQSVSHGFVSSGLFLSVGVLYERSHSRIIRDYGGLVHTMPIFAAIFFFFTLCNLGLPGTSSFIGEFILLASVFDVSPTTCFFSAVSLILGGGYSLWLFNRVAYGNSKTILFDITFRELCTFVPLIFCAVYFGLHSTHFLDATYATSTNICFSL